MMAAAIARSVHVRFKTILLCNLEHAARASSLLPYDPPVDIQDASSVATHALMTVDAIRASVHADTTYFVHVPEKQTHGTPMWMRKSAKGAASTKLFDMRLLARTRTNTVIKELMRKVPASAVITHQSARSADDIIASIARSGDTLRDKLVLWTGERGFQLISDRVSAFSAMENKVLTPQKLKEESFLKLDPKSVFTYLCLMSVWQEPSDEWVRAVAEKHPMLSTVWCTLADVDKGAQDKIEFLKFSRSIIMDSVAQYWSVNGTFLVDLNSARPWSGLASSAAHSRPTSSSEPVVQTTLDAEDAVPSDLPAPQKTPSSESYSASKKSIRLALELSEDDEEILDDIEESEDDGPKDDAGFKHFRNHKMTTVLSEEDASQLEQDLSRCSIAFMFPVEVCPSDFDHRLAGIGVCGNHTTSAYFLPLELSGSDDVFLSDSNLAERIGTLKRILAIPTLKKVLCDSKRAMMNLDRYKLALQDFDDLMVKSYVLHCGQKFSHTFSGLMEHYFDASAQESLLLEKEVVGSGRKKKSLLDSSLVSETGEFAMQRCVFVKELWQKIDAAFAQEASSKLATMYTNLELPLVEVLRSMERIGVLIDQDMLLSLRDQYSKKIEGIQSDIAEACGGEAINLNSPKQVAEMLDKLELFDGTGKMCTDAEALEGMAKRTGHPFPSKLLEFRAASKILGTYVEGLLHRIHPQTGRIHTTFQNALTTTGRLSSVDPNVQNIPVRTPEGREIRRCFLAPDGCKLVSFDYSQVELRILAHISQDAVLQDAYASGKDVHSITASQVFKVPLEQVSKEERRKAKAINFGIVYGMTAHGLSAQLGVTFEEAEQYIEQYKSTYPGINGYMQRSRDFCRKNGYVETLFGRRCHIPDIFEKRKRHMYEFALRAAINSPIQGTSADITKFAMLEIYRRFQKEKVQSRMILQIHDELMFEVPDAEMDKVKPIITQIMEGVGEPIGFSVPLTVGFSSSQRWEEK
ncbi:mitochondrial A-family DNA polymerase [Andalucia godoyi]|uniref:Mitochondrial A-family DNA polymerase n=1 Tax=Andalucia godoyi TaxID=505711 RepID=A0A8K0F4G7_ANDGO|nr:mitochondrial A-family DNA polymerase [Andalucia godoyi]|eukprot:ANDGO_06824.mRNA.1 mitochondrial A-family DNA polymerase